MKNHPGKPIGSDVVPAWLTPGEFVMNAEAASQLGGDVERRLALHRDALGAHLGVEAAREDVVMQHAEHLLAALAALIKVRVAAEKEEVQPRLPDEDGRTIREWE